MPWDVRDYWVAWLRPQYSAVTCARGLAREGLLHGDLRTRSSWMPTIEGLPPRFVILQDPLRTTAFPPEAPSYSPPLSPWLSSDLPLR
jgi:hypothetical protein